MDNLLNSLDDKTLRSKFLELRTKLDGGSFRKQYLETVRNVFRSAFGTFNDNRCIESSDVLILIKSYFKDQGFQPGEALFRKMMMDYEIGGKYDTNCEHGLNMFEFVVLVDRVNSTLIAQAYRDAIATRNTLGVAGPRDGTSVVDVD
jgi:hypothetical protein